MIALLRSRQVQKMGNKKGTILIDKEKDANLQIKRKIIEEAEQDQPFLKMKKQHHQQKEIQKKRFSRH